MQNTFKDIYGVNIVVKSSQRIRVFKNKFVNPLRLTSESGISDGIAQDTVIFADHVSDIDMGTGGNRNIFTNPSPSVSFFKATESVLGIKNAP